MTPKGMKTQKRRLTNRKEVVEVVEVVEVGLGGSSDAVRTAVVDESSGWMGRLALALLLEMR